VFCLDVRANIKRLVFITEVESGYSAVRTESLYKTQIRLVKVNFITELESVYSAVRTALI
jgi:predicted GIY-YIG superfamily endonuclease